MTVRVLRSLTVPHRLDEVVTYLSDFTRAEQWDPGTVTCRRTDAEAGPVREGSTWHNVSTFRGRRTELDYRLQRLHADRLVFVGTNSTATSTDDLTFQAHGASTEIVYRATIEFHPWWAKLAEPVLRRTFEKLGDTVTRTLPRALAEALTPHDAQDRTDPPS
ncbi:polyketide cyclase [Streptomyces sp. SID14478]|uniref:SRPBCC family protein n=1 Tax=Streptomyces sp. SID14478 TaxID=2706073 RepID=UPI0013DED25D|nr:SRPBCC family protein [Streptomyces sp. SID14478]NEB80650.1 polyketide cyclase [Streptomyces sp. SID14478]